ncbi:von Willebrand factor A domain-containing protein 5B1 [Erinaceus europaeus]|uniref:von Willebrand factor A domain-containing protein 5B1 n=1 Tax=Erinaceus europaeus TaxID=9365 RepID=A0ABM3YBD2_ERIEU|nr:von Willebrand factor A domain-containing protein 5B1 [Erinaceus europaeus]
MPGLLNQATGATLPLTASDVTSYVSGYALGLTASLTYGNLEAQPFQGIFVYPLDEGTTVIGFEAFIADRVVTVQIRDKTKLESSHTTAPRLRGSSVTGKVDLDEDLERILFVVNLGTIAPMENITVFISTSSELPTLPNGAVRILLPAICTPKVPQFCTEHTGPSSHQAQGKDKCRLGTRMPESWNKLFMASLLDTDISNPMKYEFNFQLEIHEPCLLAGVESPTHKIRADATPSACSATSVIVTLANKHTFDRPVEILIYPSEPHTPHVLMERGDMTLGEFTKHLKGRGDFIRGLRKNSSAERKTELIRKRLHKDIPHHSVIMLNFCPDLESVQSNLRRTHGEFIFLIDRSSSMSGSNIHHVKDAMLVALKSLMPACLFNVIGFGSTFNTLFPSSQTYNEESLALACESIQRMQADLGGTNILSPLQWVTRQPVHRGHPRLLFLITDGAVSNTGKVLELVRNHAFSTRCYSFGIGPRVCHRLVRGLATVSKGSAEFLKAGERLQPKMVKSLKKAMAPVLSDVTVDWIFPETTEVLISPISTSSLFPGERLVGYGIVCDVSSYFSNPRSEEGPSPDSGDCAQSAGTPVSLWRVRGSKPSSGDAALSSGLGLSHRRRAYSTNHITINKQPSWAPIASIPTTTAQKQPLRTTKLQDLTSLTSLDTPWWKVDFQPLLNSGQDPSQGLKLQGPGARRPSLLPQGCQHLQTQGQAVQNWRSRIPELSGSRPKPAADIHSPGDMGPVHPSLDCEPSWDGQAQAEPEQSGPSRPVRGKAVVRGLRDSRRLQWEVNFELGLPGPEPDSAHLWGETFHHLAARAIIRDFEQLAEREREIEQGSSRRYQLNAVHTSKACNIISKYTAFVPVDMSKSQYLPTVVGYPHSGKAGAASRLGSSQVRPQQWRSVPTGFGHSQAAPTVVSTEGRFQKLSTSLPGHVLKLGRGEEESPAAPFSGTQFPTCEKPPAEGSLCSLANSLSSLKASETLFGSRLNLNKSRLLTRAARGFLAKPLSRAPASSSAAQSSNYIPLVSLQLASGAFLLNQDFCDAVCIPMDKLKWTSPFPCHRLSLMARQPPPGAPSSQKSAVHTPRRLSCGVSSQEPLVEGKPGWETRAVTERTGELWATVVALAWLEHSSASSFVEWELVAAKASSWLERQDVPEGRTRGSLRAAARQLFVLLRHWEESLEFDVLCYDPNNL